MNRVLEKKGGGRPLFCEMSFALAVKASRELTHVD